MEFSTCRINIHFCSMLGQKRSLCSFLSVTDILDESMQGQVRLIPLARMPGCVVIELGLWADSRPRAAEDGTGEDKSTLSEKAAVHTELGKRGTG